MTSTLVASDHEIRETIGTVNAAEFFVTLAESAAFFLTIGTEFGDYLPAVLGLLAGGVAASPIAAVLCRKLPLKPLLASVGLLIIGLNAWKLISALT